MTPFITNFKSCYPYINSMTDVVCKTLSATPGEHHWHHPPSEDGTFIKKSLSNHSRLSRCHDDGGTFLEGTDFWVYECRCLPGHRCHFVNPRRQSWAVLVGVSQTDVSVARCSISAVSCLCLWLATELSVSLKTFISQILGNFHL